MTSKTHPHAEATYQVIPFADGSFGVEVNIPQNYPTIVRNFRDRGCGRGVDYRASAAGADRKRVGPLVSEVRWHRSPPERPAMSRA